MAPRQSCKRTNRLAAALGPVCLLLLLPVGPARALLGDSDENFGLDGNLRTVTAATVNYDYPMLFGPDNASDGLSQSLLRLVAGGSPAEWLLYELHAVQSLNFSSSSASLTLGPGLFAGGATHTRYRAATLRWDWAEEADLQASLWLDRAQLKFVLPFADLTIGRQAISFGKAYFWNPLDVFLAFDPRSFDRDYKAGVDALRIDIPFGDFSGLNLVASLGRRIGGLGSTVDPDDFKVSWHGSALMARVFTTWQDWDIAVQGGKVYGGYQLGGAASGELGALAVRAEAAYQFTVDREELPNHLNLVLGVGHRFENTLNL